MVPANGLHTNRISITTNLALYNRGEPLKNQAHDADGPSSNPGMPSVFLFLLRVRTLPLPVFFPTNLMARV